MGIPQSQEAKAGHRVPAHQVEDTTMKYVIALFLVAAAGAVEATPAACPQAMPPAVASRLLPVLKARDAAVAKHDWLDPQYESAIESLLQAQDDASREARVALMDYEIGEAYRQELECAVAFDGKRMIPLLQLYSRCDIAPAHATSPRIHASTLRGETLKILENGKVGEECNFD